MLQAEARHELCAGAITKAAQEVQLENNQTWRQPPKTSDSNRAGRCEAAWPVQPEIDSREALVQGSERKQLAQLR